MPVSSYSSVRQLGDGSTTGLSVGSALDSAGNPFKLTFYGGTPVVQPSGSAELPVSRGQAAGVIATYGSTQSPSAVAANTSAEQTLTVVSGTGGQMLPAAGDLLYVNKPTAQAGLGFGNVRVSSSNTLGITFHNLTSGSITPTASQAYTVVGIRGLGNISAVLSPATVAATTIVEQQFPVTGLPVGTLVQVNKPTAQAGLDIVGCRVVSNNVLGITFANYTASPITPTAGETYLVLPLAGIDATNNSISYGFNAGTIGAIGAGVVASAGNTALTGLLATDMVTGVFDPTAQAAATNAAYPVKAIPTANTLTLYFAGIGTGATPTANEVYGINTVRLSPVAPLILYSTISIAPGSVAANTSAEQTFTVTGLVAGSPVWVNKPSATFGIGISGVRVSAANTLAINFENITAAAITPPTEMYIIGNFQVPSPGAGNVVYQTVSPALNSIGNSDNATLSALKALNLIAGQ